MTINKVKKCDWCNIGETLEPIQIGKIPYDWIEVSVMGAWTSDSMFKGIKHFHCEECLLQFCLSQTKTK